MDWRAFQDEVAELFRDLGADARVEETVSGTRGKHQVDVWVRFSRFGLEIKWVVECKYWNSRVPKEKVLALQAIVADVGADRGVMISKEGFQSGAVRAATKTNVTLTAFHDLKDAAYEELEASVLQRLETMATDLRYQLLNVNRDDSTNRSVLLPGVAAMLGNLSVLANGFTEVRKDIRPYRARFNHDGNTLLAVYTIDEFITAASGLVREAESLLASIRTDCA